MKNKTQIKTTKSKKASKVKTTKKAAKKTTKATKAKAAKKIVKKAAKAKTVKKVIKKTAKAKAVKKTVKKAKAVKKTVKKVKAVKKTTKATKPNLTKKAVKAKAVKKEVKKSTTVKVARKVVKKPVTPKSTSQTTEVDTTQVGNDTSTTDDASESSEAKSGKIGFKSTGKKTTSIPVLKKMEDVSLQKKTTSERTGKTGNKKKGAFLFLANEAEVVPSTIQAKTAEQVKVEIEILEDENRNFIFVLPGARKNFSLDEMRNIVRICHHAENENNAVEEMYKWLFDNRGDILNDCNIHEGDNTVLGRIYSIIMSTYKLKGE